MGVVDSIYETIWMGPCIPRIDSECDSFLAEQPRGKHGVHEYSLEEFDISPKELTTHFADYLDFLASAPKAKSLVGGSSDGK